MHKFASSLHDPISIVVHANLQNSNSNIIGKIDDGN